MTSKLIILSIQNMCFIIIPYFFLFKRIIENKHLQAKCVICATGVHQMEIHLYRAFIFRAFSFYRRFIYWVHNCYYLFHYDIKTLLCLIIAAMFFTFAWNA